MLVYLAAKAGMIGASDHSSPAAALGLPMFTIGPVLADCVLVYFQQGALRLAHVIGIAMLLYAAVLVWPFVIASNEGRASFAEQDSSYFLMLNFVGFLIFGGVTAWLGKLFGILTVAAFSFSAYAGTSELLVLTPALALLNVTSPMAQWAVAIVVTASSFLADRQVSGRTGKSQF
jgi:hypothetical protein